MADWRTLGTPVILLVAVTGAWADSIPLVEEIKTGDCFRMSLEMSLKGDIHLNRDGKLDKLPLTAKATHEFTERVLAVGSTGLIEKSARVYDTATATITVDRDRSEKGLRKERRLLVKQRPKEQPLTYSPAGSMTREELELTDEHFDTQCLTGLLPGKNVALGETWKVPSPVASSLCHFEGLTEQDLTCKLAEVKDKVARIVVSGTAQGIEQGAQVKLQIQADLRFNLDSKRLTHLEWKQTDQREQGPVSPALTAESSYTVTRSPVPLPEALADVSLVSVPSGFTLPEPLTLLEYRDPKERFELGYAREWQVVAQMENRLVLRLMERGDFVAQATITCWTPAPKGQHLSEEEFKTAMTNMPGWLVEKELQSGEVPSGGNRWVYRHSTLGKMDGVAVVQNFYLVAAPSGEQIVVAVTLTPKKVDQLGSRDLALAGSIDFPKKEK